MLPPYLRGPDPRYRSAQKRKRREVQLLVGRVEVNEQIEYLTTTQSGRAPGRSTLLITTIGSGRKQTLFWLRSAFAASGRQCVNHQQH